MTIQKYAIGFERVVTFVHFRFVTEAFEHYWSDSERLEVHFRLA